jgi:hypothetical protein
MQVSLLGQHELEKQRALVADYGREIVELKLKLEQTQKQLEDQVRLCAAAVQAARIGMSARAEAKQLSGQVVTLRAELEKERNKTQCADVQEP